MEHYISQIIKILTTYPLFFWTGIVLLFLLVLVLAAKMMQKRRINRLCNKIQDSGMDKLKVADNESDEELKKQGEQEEEVGGSSKFQNQDDLEAVKENDIPNEQETEIIKETVVKIESTDARKFKTVCDENDKDSKSVITESHRRECKNLLEKDIDKQLQKVSEIFRENKLIGNYDFPDEEYIELLENTSLLSCSFMETGGCNVFETKYHQLIFITLIELAKRWRDTWNEEKEEEGSPFWEYIYRHLLSDRLLVSGVGKLYQAFIDVFKHLEKHYSLSTVKTGKKYYSTVMMHAFAPKDSMFSFFDLCYNIFKKALDFVFTSDDEWICEIVANELRSALGGDYSEAKKVSIGSSIYSIKIGLRSFALHEDLHDDFKGFIKNTLHQINQLINQESIEKNTRLDGYIYEWWKSKTESDIPLEEITSKRRLSSVTKEEIVARYIREDDSVFVYVPSIRLKDDHAEVRLIVYINENSVGCKTLDTKRGEFIITTKQTELNLNDLLRGCKEINLRIQIEEDDILIFDSEKSKTTSLNREFILFEDEKEVLSHINKPTNYFVYSRNIDALKKKPKELKRYGQYLYNIYPIAGEKLTGEKREVFFVDRKKRTSLGSEPCLIGDIPNIDWHSDDVSYVVYSSGVKLLIPENANLRALELRVNEEIYKLHQLSYEGIESSCFQYGLRKEELIDDNHPTIISLYSYEEEKEVLNEKIIVLPNLNIEFNRPYYYDNMDRELMISDGEKDFKLTWSNQDNEIRYSFNGGILLIKIPYLKWRVNEKEWHKESIKRKLWYKEYLENGDRLEIDCPIESEDITVSGQTDEEFFNLESKIKGSFEIGRAIYNNEDRREITVNIKCGDNKHKLFEIATKEHFVDNPLKYVDDKVLWAPEDVFVGDKDTQFLLTIESTTPSGNSIIEKVIQQNQEIIILKKDIYKVNVKTKEKNPFIHNKESIIYEGVLYVGTFDELRFKNKKIILLSGNCFKSKRTEWVDFAVGYSIHDVELILDDKHLFYFGNLHITDDEGEEKKIDVMINENDEYEEINPVRIEIRDNSTFWLVARWEGGDNNDHSGTLFIDKKNRSICNIQKQDVEYDEIYLFKFKEEHV